MASSNRQYKDGVFTSLFGTADKMLELYNAINDTHYPQSTPLEIITLQETLFAPLKNDLAFVIDDRFVMLVEHQSTLSENMPLRMLMYLAREYERLVETSTRYREKRVTLPTPETIVLYNGTAAMAPEQILRLSDAYKEPSKPLTYLELLVRVININYGQQSEILTRSTTLHDYSLFIDIVRQQQALGKSRDEAIKAAIEICIAQGILADYLKTHGSEVYNMLLTEWNIDDAQKVWRQEGLEEGMEKGLAKGRLEERRTLVRKLLDVLDDQTLAEKSGLPLSEIKKLRAARP